jgi:hypothetical protein
MTGIQLVAICFALVMLFVTYTTLRRHELRIPEAVIWIAIWVGLILISLFPAVLRTIIVPLHVIRLLDLVTIVGLLLLAAIVFRLNVALRRVEGRVITLIRSLALDQGSSPAPPATDERSGSRSQTTLKITSPQDGSR